MAKYKAVKSFGGIVSMSAGMVKEIANADVANDLMKAGYIVEIKPAEKVTPAKTKKGAKKNEE